jgi:hypothetical protein
METLDSDRRHQRRRRRIAFDARRHRVDFAQCPFQMPRRWLSDSKFGAAENGIAARPTRYSPLRSAWRLDGWHEKGVLFTFGLDVCPDRFIDADDLPKSAGEAAGKKA